MHSATEQSLFVTLDTCQRSPIRRQSFSAPARICLARLDTATKALGKRVHSLSQVVRSSSSGSLNLPGAANISSSCPTPGGDIVGPGATTMVRTCHGCHAPLDEDHQAYPSGHLKCQLEHWEGCKGGVLDGKAANGSEWRACPDDMCLMSKWLLTLVRKMRM